MSLRLYNTRTRKKEDFQPLDPDKGVRMYVCGPTVYDFAHIGNARPVIVFDVLFRLLRYLADRGEWGEGVTVKYARNITDVDDKINARAAEEGVPIGELTERTTAQFHADMAALGCLPPDFEPRATDYVSRENGKPDMIGMIRQLIDNGCAYEAEGHVLFDVSAWPDYGSLSRRPLDEMKAGARVEVAPYKRDPMDFVLWKPSKEGEPGWDSPWGWGRPGWHLECSTMSAALLGEVFDIHGGGIDLQFPHHENEVAQSCCANRTDIMANFWLHNGYLMVEGEKMAKSMGNFITVRDLLEKWPGDVVRLQMLMTLYRQPIDWTETGSDLVSAELEDWATVLAGYFPMADGTNPPDSLVAALSDDLNTPDALTVLRELYSKAKSGGMNEIIIFAEACKFLGFRKVDKPGLFNRSFSGSNIEPKKLFEQADNFDRLRAAIANDAPQSAQSNIILEMEDDLCRVEIGKDGTVELRGNDQSFTQRVNELIEARNEARKAKNFAEADRIRDELKAMGIQLKDSRDPETGEITTTWEIAR